ncbi:hypothetical protein BDR03DRAFT_286789 [Suillus americanus]|nr:hypothetical protein BDR03DRAFT_286789 [Suillus americanus]
MLCMFGRLSTVVVLMNHISQSVCTYSVCLLTFTIFASSDLQHTGSVPTILLTDAVSRIVYVIWDWMNVVVIPILGVIMIARLHAMYQRSRKILIFLVVTFLSAVIFSGVVSIMTTLHTSWGTLNCRCKKCA